MICAGCGAEYEPGVKPDPCLGKLPGVLEACCGHGQPYKGYVMFRTGLLVRGFRRIERYDLKKKKDEEVEPE